MPRIPTFADLGFNDPSAGGALPQYPATDPQAAALGVAGQALEKAGTAAFGIAARQEADRQALNEAAATTDFVNRLVPLHTKISLATDPNEIAALKEQYNNILPTSGQTIDNPQRRALWLSRHANTLVQAQADADERIVKIDRQNYGTGIERQLDALLENAKNSGDPKAFDIAKLTGKALIDAAGKYGIPAQTGYEWEKRFDHGLEIAGSHAAVKSVVLDALGMPRSQTGMAVGGAIPSRIVEAAASNNIDPTTALATAQIESGMGANLGARGNIFQLGRSEWAASGGGQMGDTETDIRNGVGFLAKTQNDLREKLGRDPQPWETYLAHQQGVGGAAALLSNPDKPAGQVVPSQNISANGGDPNAPASAFVSQWRSKFTQVAAGITPPAGKSSDVVAFGDSIAAHLIRKAGAGGQESGKVGVYNAGDTAVSGWTPTQVLQAISGAPDDSIRGKSVVLSTGASNNPSQLDSVPEQIKALKDRGATSVTLMGVGTAEKLSGVNDKLAQIANDNGATFAGPLRKVASDGIHSSDPKAELAALRQAAPGTQAPVDTGGGEGQPGSIGGPQRNRSGLPSLSQMNEFILRDPRLKTDEQRLAAMQAAQARYTAAEADAARAERIAAGAQKQQVEQRTNQIYSDVYSDNPQITARQIAVDPAFDSAPERRKQMIELVNDPPGSKIPAAQSYAAAQSLIKRIRLPEGNQQKITDAGQIYDSMNLLNRSDFDFVMKQFNDIRAPGGETLKSVRSEFMNRYSGFITRSNPLIGAKDPVGEARAYEYDRLIDSKIDDYRKSGKNPLDLFNPKNPDFLGAPETLREYQPPMNQSEQSLIDFAEGNPRLPLPPVGTVPPVQQQPLPGDAAFAPIPPAPNARKPGEGPADYLKRRGLE